jgi:uncharacterized protein (TIGR02147 family)
MSETPVKLIQTRPLMSDFVDVRDFLKAALEYRKKTEKGFSVYQAVTRLRKISPALVSLILQKKRKLTLDRADDFAKLLNLSSSEKIFFKNWITLEEKPAQEKTELFEARGKNKKEFAVSLLNDWLNVYVKDAFRIPALQKNPELIYKELGSIASYGRIKKAMAFLLREGYLRKTLDGRIVIETSLVTQEAPPPGAKIRAFHKAALSIARQNMDLFSVNERFANTMIIDLTPERYQELIAMIQEFSRELQNFAAVEEQNGDRLYQVLVHLTPTGGRVV